MILGHGLTQFGLSLPDETWRPWMQAYSAQTVGAFTILLFASRLAIDLGLCLWIIGPHRLKPVLALLHLPLHGEGQSGHTPS